MVGALEPESLRKGDVLVIVDVQNDFVSGTLPVPDGEEVVVPLNEWIRAFEHEHLVTVATRAWHPANHRSFQEQGGSSPPHCVAGTKGAAFVSRLKLPPGAWLVSKATAPDRDACSAFEGTDLDARLKRLGAKRLFIGGLATDTGVVRTVIDAIGRGYGAVVLEDAIRAMDVQPGDGEKAEAEMSRAGAAFIRLADLVEEKSLD